MEHYTELIGAIALAMGVGWASGLNLYAVILVLGLLGATGNMTLPANLEIVTHPLVIGAAALMYLVEFFADKTPAVDSAWDALHTFIRIPAGAVLAAGALGEVNPDMAVNAQKPLSFIHAPICDPAARARKTYTGWKGGGEA